MASYFKKAFWSSVISLILSFLAGGTSYITRIILARNLQTSGIRAVLCSFTFVIFFFSLEIWVWGRLLVRYIAELEVHKRYDDIKTAIISVLTIQFASSAVFGIIFFFLLIIFHNITSKTLPQH